MKIALATLNSKYIHSNLSLWCIEAGIDAFCSEEHDITVIESTVNADTEKFLEEIVSLSPQLVAFSCYIWNIQKILPLCKSLKDRINCTIVLGGPEVEYRSENILATDTSVDYVISGEGEWSFSSFVEYLDGKITLENIEGISFMRDGALVNIPIRKHCETPPSPYSDKYFSNLHGRISYIEASRGCPYRCAYCLSGQISGFRYFDEESVFSDIVRLSQSGTKTIKFIDRTFNASAEKADRILSFIKENYGKLINPQVCFHFEIAADILKESTMDILSDMPAGLIQLEIGIQSFNKKTLQAINRKSELNKLCENIKRLVSFRNIHIHTDLIAGLPFEDIKCFKNSFNSAFFLKSDMLQLGFLKLLHGSEMRKISYEYPSEFNSDPPYEIISNKWLSADDIAVLRGCEEALDRLYNSGRFLITTEYLFDKLKLDPFDTFTEFGCSFDFNGISLSDFTERLWLFFRDKCDSDKLRDCILCDLCTLPVNIKVPACLAEYNPLYKRMKKKYSELYHKNVRIVLMKSEKSVFVVHTDITDKISGRYYSECFPFD